MGKRFVSGALVLALATGFTLATAGMASATATQEYKFVSLINHERTRTDGKIWSCGRSGGMNSLVIKSDLVAVARDHSQDMAEAKKIWHASGTPYKVSGWTVYGENVGMSPMSDDVVETLHRAFMNSTEHCDNVLYSRDSSKTFNQIGVGVVVSDDMMYVTVIFVRRGSVSSTSTSSGSTTSYHKSTSTNSTSSASSSSGSGSSYTPPAAPAKPKPKPKPPAVATPQTVDLLVRMAGMDSDQVDPATGAAAGF